ASHVRPLRSPGTGTGAAPTVICGRPLGKRVFDGLIALVGCGHMSGLWCGIGPLALMIFDSPGPYHRGELWARDGYRGVRGFRGDRVVHHVVALAKLFETETPILESSVFRPSCKV